MSQPPIDRQSFATTCWSDVRRAAQLTDQAGDSLERLCSQYWFPLYAFLRRSGHGAEESQDYVQSFFADLLSRESLASADPQRGRFRTFLLTACRNHVSNIQRADRAIRRGGGRRTINWETADGETRYEAEPVEHWTPESLFRRKWALAVIDSALARIRQEYKSKGREDRFDALYPLVAPSATAPAHAEIAERLDCSVGAVKVAAHRLRGQLGTTLREEIADTVDSEADQMGERAIDDELAILLAALRGE